VTESKLDKEARAAALKRFRGAWGHKYDPERDATDNRCLDQLIQQERESISRTNEPTDA